MIEKTMSGIFLVALFLSLEGNRDLGFECWWVKKFNFFLNIISLRFALHDTLYVGADNGYRVVFDFPHQSQELKYVIV